MISIEAFFVLNAAMDACIVVLALKWLDTGRLNALRITLAACAGAAYACAAWAARNRALLTPPLLFTAAWLVMRVASGRVPFKTTLKGAGYFLAAAFLIGGTVFALTGLLRELPLAAALASGTAVAGLAALALGRNKKRSRWEYGRITIRYRETQAAFDAAVDSGNHAVDPISGLPAVIATFETMAEVFPKLLDGGLPEGMRLIVLNAVSGKTLAPCFTPDVITWNGEPIRAAVAIAPRARLSVALAPSSFGDTAHAVRRLA